MREAKWFYLKSELNKCSRKVFVFHLCNVDKVLHPMCIAPVKNRANLHQLNRNRCM